MPYRLATPQTLSFKRSIAVKVNLFCPLPTFLALALALGGCQDAPEGPEQTLRSFLRDVRAQRSEAAWAALTPDNQTALKARYAAGYRARAPEAKDDSGLLFTELGLVSLAEPSSVIVVSPLSRPEVRLRVSIEGGESASFVLRKIEGRWKVDLLEALQPVQTSTAAKPAAP